MEKPADQNQNNIFLDVCLTCCSNGYELASTISLFTTNVRSDSKMNMHKYVWSLVGVFVLFAVTFPIALKRVSQDDKFSGFHVKSVTLEGQLESKR